MSGKNDDILDKFDITTGGSLLEDIKRVDIKMSQVPEIEVREVVIKETGNFLNLRENIINIPIEIPTVSHTLLFIQICQGVNHTNSQKIERIRPLRK